MLTTASETLPTDRGHNFYTGSSILSYAFSEFKRELRGAIQREKQENLEKADSDVNGNSSHNWSDADDRCNGMGGAKWQ